jgi:hypothetical protein
MDRMRFFNDAFTLPSASSAPSKDSRKTPCLRFGGIRILFVEREKCFCALTSVSAAGKANHILIETTAAMGSTSSQAVPSSTVLATTQAVMSAFLPIFVKAFGVRMVELALEVRQIAEGGRLDAVERRLLNPPIATRPLQVGWMLVMTGKMMSWKRRCAAVRHCNISSC